ncbi:MAG: hypothetical protein CME04_04525 [Gemmatimonadaceae bacterium]|nr:hypothetical protein [Gemmatimonadaceae bacterium]
MRGVDKGVVDARPLLQLKAGLGERIDRVDADDSYLRVAVVQHEHAGKQRVVHSRIPDEELRERDLSSADSGYHGGLESSLGGDVDGQGTSPWLLVEVYGRHRASSKRQVHNAVDLGRVSFYIDRRERSRPRRRQDIDRDLARR